MQTRAVSRSASSLKTLSKAGWLCRSLLKSGFEMIKTSMAVQARTVAFRVRSESKAISPKYSPRPIENNLDAALAQNSFGESGRASDISGRIRAPA